ncbi:predicted protein [Streptomyces viridochromogenes DSM 40736]|uniref:Predicted protein n=1 Tax=Streptomyces viridochromogenes (strain DSM 40736 / JCM 4977 / BCRC 1201 / Tue 494) TaxID=591159 RepID=D9X2Q0_STRVT|nr:predicted protein [Streptomyces viridochromogenes DSM 40736]
MGKVDEDPGEVTYEILARKVDLSTEAEAAKTGSTGPRTRSTASRTSGRSTPRAPDGGSRPQKRLAVRRRVAIIPLIRGSSGAGAGA